MNTKRISAAAAGVLIVMLLPVSIFAGSLFGPPQPVSRPDGGLHTAIGYWRYEDKFKDGGDYVLKQNQLYTHAGYGARDLWEVYGRLGVADMKLENAFSPTDALTSASRSDLNDTWNNFFGTLGGKLFYPYGKIFGVGAFLQGTYFFNYFSDGVSGTRAGGPYTAGLKIKNMWDLNFGIGGQMAVADTKFYLGPYFHHAEANASPAPAMTGLQFASDTTIKNKSSVGVFAGIDAPLGRGFRFNIEAHYCEELSIGAGISFTY